MSMELYYKVSHQVSRLVTNRYSTSFSLGIKLFPRDIQEGIYGIYGFVRFADEIVDTFQGIDKEKLLGEFKRDAYAAIDARVSSNPILHAFQDIFHRYQIRTEYIDAFLDSMEMDITQSRYDKERYDKYIYGSAEAVGLMCLQVFCRGKEDLFEELIEPASQLGSAFQKVNFLRDLKSDYEYRGRIYMPGIDHKENIDAQAKQRMEEEIEQEFAQAFEGIKKLPKEAKFAVYSVYLYYQALFQKLKGTDVKELLERRVRISNFTKFRLLIKAYLNIKSSKI